MDTWAWKWTPFGRHICADHHSIGEIHRWPVDSNHQGPLFYLLLRHYAWWRHQMETFSALLALCAENSPVAGEFPAQRPMTQSFDVFFDMRLNKRLSKQSWGWWFDTPSCSLWRHCKGFEMSSFWDRWYEFWSFLFITVFPNEVLDAIWSAMNYQ